jgi:hypothetical protein
MALPKLDHDLGGGYESVPDSNGAESERSHHLTFLNLLVLTVMRWATPAACRKAFRQLPLIRSRKSRELRDATERLVEPHLTPLHWSVRLNWEISLKRHSESSSSNLEVLPA